MTYASVKSLMRTLDAGQIQVDGGSETARFFMPTSERRIEIAPRGVTVTRRSVKARSRLRRFIRIS